MKEAVVALARQLIEIESISGNEKPMSDFLKPWFEERGWRVTLQEAAPGRYNVLALRGEAPPRLIFNSHIDTVPPYIPFRLEDEVIYGRGACDTKSLIAAQLLAGEDLLAAGVSDFGYLYVVGEEVDHCGMKAANSLGLDPEFLIVGEPTESKLVRRQKGILKVRLEAAGKAAHSGYPHLGDSAVDKLLDACEALRKHEWPNDTTLGETTLNIGTIAGGRAANVVPDQAHAEVMFRVVTDHEAVMAEVERLVDGRVSVRFITGNPPVDLTTLDGYETTIVAFNTDIPYFNFSGKALLWGAGSILDAHTAGEKIGVGELTAAVDTYRELAMRLLRT